jgi:hypothetical protein
LEVAGEQEKNMTELIDPNAPYNGDTEPTPANHAPRTLPTNKENYCLRLLCTYLLYERARETEMRTMVEGLITERHRHFHSNGDEKSDWRDCVNQVCVSARLLLDQAREPEVELNEFAVQMMQAYTINFQPRVEGGQLAGIKSRLVEIAKLFDTVKPPQQKNEEVILP